MLYYFIVSWHLTGFTIFDTYSWPAQSDGTTTSGTYTSFFTDNSGTHITREGVLTFGTTDGRTYSLSGAENPGFCDDPDGVPPIDATAGVAGDCGEDVTILYSDFWTLLTLAGNVECTLT